jgi:NAD(P)-dependent dehydrogenase (short-subunit alcohol dehydrogenase family)
MYLQNKHILVTGGTGYLGPEIVRNLLSDGNKVTSISRHDFENLELDDAISLNFKHYNHDIDERSNFEEIIRKATTIWGKLDGLIIMTNKGSRNVDLNEDKDLFAHNFGIGTITTFTILTGCSNFLNKKASIIIFGSVWGIKIPFRGMYLDMPIEPSLSLPASKAALLQLAKSFASEFSSSEIRVNVLTPGWFPKPGKITRDDYIETISDRTPLRRIGVPQDLVGPVRFLLSESSSFITGQNLIVDGGFSIY